VASLTRLELATPGVTGRRSSVSLRPGKPNLKCVPNGCLKQYKAAQNCDNFRVPLMVPKRQFSRGIWERAWRESNTRPAA
jgi:hypothetical protein